MVSFDCVFKFSSHTSVSKWNYHEWNYFENIFFLETSEKNYFLFGKFGINSASEGTKFGTGRGIKREMMIRAVNLFQNNNRPSGSVRTLGAKESVAWPSLKFHPELFLASHSSLSSSPERSPHSSEPVKPTTKERIYNELWHKLLTAAQNGWKGEICPARNS